MTDFQFVKQKKSTTTSAHWQLLLLNSEKLENILSITMQSHLYYIHLPFELSLTSFDVTIPAVILTCKLVNSITL